MADHPTSGGRKPSGAASQLSTATAQMVRLRFADVTSAMIRELAGYWSELRGERPVANKKEFDPSRVTSLLPYLIVAEYHQNPFRIRYRLVGTEQVRHAGEDFTGKWLHETLWDPRYIEVWLTATQEMTETGEPAFGRDSLLWTDGKIKECEWGLFPLSADGRSVTHGIGIEDFSKIESKRGLFAPD